MNHDHYVHAPTQHVDGIPIEVTIVVYFICFFAIVLYIGAVVSSNRRSHLRRWSIYRMVLWILGVCSAAIALVGPLADRAHDDFTVHMIGHLLLGMLAPLLMVLSAPMTLTLRTLRVSLARRLTKLLRSWPSRMFTHPIITSILNIGGLWLLYTTNLYSLMHESLLLHLIVHFHVFVAGYLYTISMIYIDPVSHQIPYVYRAIVLVISLAGHGILSKFIYANPPAGVPLEQAELGGMLMYYGGDAIDIVIIFVLCLQWFRATRPRPRLAPSIGHS